MIYQLERNICEIQYDGKRERSSNIRLKNHSKDVKDASAIEADKHFTSPDHYFNTNAKFVLTEQLISRKNIGCFLPCFKKTGKKVQSNKVQMENGKTRIQLY